jgi:hypothetical protein
MNGCAGCVRVGGGELGTGVGGGGNVIGRLGVAAGGAHPSNNMTSVINPIIFRKIFRLFILCSFSIS